MKRFIFFLFFASLLNNTDIIANEKHRYHFTNPNDDNKPYPAYTYYFWIKEMCKVYIHSYFIDEQKINKAQIACCQCNKTTNSGSLWGYAISEVDETMITKLMPLIYNGSTEEITAYLLAMYKEHQIECCICRKYNDWYIVEQQSSPQI